MSADKRNDACSTPAEAECYGTQESHISRARRPRAAWNQFPMSPNNLAAAAAARPPATAARCLHAAPLAVPRALQCRLSLSVKPRSTRS